MQSQCQELEQKDTVQSKCKHQDERRSIQNTLLNVMDAPCLVMS